MQIYWNKRKRLHKKRVQLPEDWFGTPTWPPWRHVKTLFCVYGWWRVGSKNEDRLANILLFEVSKKIRLNHSCQNLNSHLLPLYTSYTKSGESVCFKKCQENSSCVLVSLILITTLSYKPSILQGEIWFWSSLGLKGFNAICALASLPS